MSVLPSSLEALLEEGLRAVKNHAQREDLRFVARGISTATWQHWQAWRPSEDNRPEHEWLVFVNVMKIAESEGLNLSERRIATAFSFTHDTFFIPRITETEIRAVDNAVARAERDKAKKQQRLAHMEGGAKNAWFILGQLKYPTDPDHALLTTEEIKRCVDIVAKHDCWKLGEPHPLGSDHLAVVCLEGDALWPLHPLGVLADLERPGNDGKAEDTSEPATWLGQLRENLETLREYQANWKDSAGETFVDGESIFRTKEGHRLYREWRKRWSL